MQEEMIVKYIGEAVIMLTAEHLGVAVEMIDEARKVWRTKRLPEGLLLGRYDASAVKAAEEINTRGLGETADRLAHVFYMTGSFPQACQIKEFEDYTEADIYRFPLGDCTNGGISSGTNKLTVFARHLTFAQVAYYCLENKIPPAGVLKLVYREHINYVHAEPLINRHRQYMAGGNYIYSSDSRFKMLSGIRYPVPIHDRAE